MGGGGAGGWRAALLAVWRLVVGRDWEDDECELTGLPRFPVTH